MQIVNYNLMLLTEMNILGAVYCHNRLGYNIVCSYSVVTADIGSQGGVGVVMREQPEGWIIESMRFHYQNLVSCKIVSSAQENPLIRLYLSPSNCDHLLYFEEALNCFPGMYPIVMGDLNDISESQAGGMGVVLVIGGLGGGGSMAN